MDSAFEVLEIKSDREIKVRKLTPAIYVWTTEAYQKSNIYKIGLVNWQSVERRLKANRYDWYATTYYFNRKI